VALGCATDPSSAVSLVCLAERSVSWYRPSATAFDTMNEISACQVRDTRRPELATSHSDVCAGQCRVALWRPVPGNHSAAHAVASHVQITARSMRSDLAWTSLRTGIATGIPTDWSCLSGIGTLFLQCVFARRTSS